MLDDEAIATANEKVLIEVPEFPKDTLGIYVTCAFTTTETAAHVAQTKLLRLYRLDVTDAERGGEARRVFAQDGGTLGGIEYECA